MIIDGIEYIKKEDQSKTVCNISDDSSIATNYIGRFVLTRSRNKGICAGTVVAADKTGVQLENCRRLWYHKPANKDLSWYEGVAISGLSQDSKVSAITEGVLIIENYEMILTTAEAKKSIMEFKSHAQA